MSEGSSPCDTSPSGEREPTVVSMVGSSIAEDIANSWETTPVLASHDGTHLCVSPLDDNSMDAVVPNQVSSAICHSDSITPDDGTATSFIHSRLMQDADSSSGSLGMCDEDPMMVDRVMAAGTSVSAIVSHEALSQDSDNSEDDHMTVMDNIAAQNFLRETDLLNATSVLNSEKSSDDAIHMKSDIAHNLMSSLEHHDTEPMEMGSLLPDHGDLDRQVPSIADYHLDHSQGADLTCGNSSEIHIVGNSVRDMQTDICFSSSSTSNASDLSSGTCMGLPPVSTIIRSSVAKGRFDAFCRPQHINMIMDMPPFLNSSGSYNAISSMGAIQRIGSDHCDVLTAVSLTSPLDVSSSRQNPCTDLGMESVDVSSVCSATGSRLIGSRCIKPTSSVMSTLGPDLMDKHDSLNEMDDSSLQNASDSLSLPLTSSSSISSFPGTIPIREIISLGGSSQESLLRMEEIQKVAAIKEHLRSETTSEEALAHSMISPHHFNCRRDVHQTFADELSHNPQSLSLIPVSAIETNVIMSTSNAESSKIGSSEIKVIESVKQMTAQQLENLEVISQQLEDSAAQTRNISKHMELPRASSIVFSTGQNALAAQQNNLSVVFTSSNNMSGQNLVSRSSIIERTVVQHGAAFRRANACVSVEDTTESRVLLQAKSDQLSSKLPKINEKVRAENQQRLTTVSPSAVTASVIQQLLKSQAPNLDLRSGLQRISGGVITSVTSAKSELASLSHNSGLISTPSAPKNMKVKHEICEELSNEPTVQADKPQRTLLISVGNNEKLHLHLNDDSLDLSRDRSPDLSPTLDSDKESSPLPNLSAVGLPSFFSNLSATALASIQSSLKASLPVSLPTSLPSIAGAAVSLLPSFQPGFGSPSLPAVPSIILPNILSPLRNTSKSPETIIPSTTASAVTTGLLKSVGLSTIIKREHENDGISGPLPPFTVVSGLSSLVKREFASNLASSFLNSNSSGSQIPVLTIKHEPGSKHSSASASDFTTSSLLNAGSVQIPSSSSPLELSVVVAACSTTAATTVPTTSPVPSQASTIAFASNALAAAVSSASTTHSTTAKQDESSSEKKWNCTMCKNGSPCRLHPSSQGSSSVAASSSVPAPPPLLSGDPAKPFQCTLCGKHLASKNVYQLHLRSHSGEKPFTCNLCGHHFSQKTSLTRHMRSHTGERPFPCEACGKRFADKERIKIHMRTHTGEKPFACEVCGKRFSQKSTVKRHMSVHTGEKPFKCDTCGKGFANRGNLNAHSKTHANT